MINKKGFSIRISQQEVKVNSFAEDSYDTIHIQEPHLELLFEGVLLNRKKLLQQFALTDFKTLLLELYFQKKENVVKEFEGEFRGFICDKEKKKLWIFTNATSTQRIFYSKIGKDIFIDSNLIRLSEELRNNGYAPEPNMNSIYQLLAFSGLLENDTIIENAFKLRDGHFLELNIEKESLKEVEYFSTFNEPYFNKSKEEALKNIHDIFTDSVKMEYEKDDELGKNHLALLSGGLDSRVAIMYAMQNDEKPDSVLCFSQSGYFDETISRKIAEDHQLHYEFVPLDGGSFLKKIDQLTEISEGLVLYTGGIHAQHAMDKLQYENFALFHSGQIGDGILGGFNSEPKMVKPNTFKMIFNEEFFSKVESYFNEIQKKYDSEETFLIRNLAYNKVLLGAHVFQQKAYQTSPFMSKDFLKFAIALPESWKFKHQFYIEWISKYCPESTKYIWERTLMKPNASWKTQFGDRFVKAAFIKLNEKVFKTPEKSSMYPYQYYFDQSVEIQNFYQNYFKKNLERLSEYPELKTDVERLFSKPGFYSKAQAIHILALFKLFFS